MIWDIVTAATAFIAAGFWFASAYGRLPLMSSYYDYTPPSDPFYKAVKLSANLNKVAAVFAGTSALSSAGKIVAEHLG